MFLVYNIDDGDEPFGDDQVFIANGIKLLPFSGWFDDSGFNGWFEDNRDWI